MKIRGFLFFLTLFGFYVAFGQSTEEFGSVKVAELSNEMYAKDTASAIVLFDVGDLVVEPNAVSGSILKRHTRVKILKPQAFKEWGNLSFYIPKEGSIKIKGATYNLENGVVRKSELEQSAIMRTSYNRQYELVRIPFPNVREGSIVEFSYTLRHPDLYVHEWQFQHSIPSRKSQYTVTVPVKNIKYNLRGLLKPAVHDEKYEGTYHHWLFTDIPAFVEEPLMDDEDAYISCVDFAVRYYNWGGAYHMLTQAPDFGEVVHKYKFLSETVKEVTAGFTEEKQKIKAISDYIKRVVQYDGNETYYGTNPNDIIDKKKGSAGEINLLFGSMLEKAGLKVSMVLLSTRDNGSVDKNLPSLAQFNYVVCEVATKDGDILVDATDKLLAYDMLPPRCFNYQGFLVGTSQYGWVPIEPRHRYKMLLDATVTITEAGALKGTLKSFKDGYAAYDVRSKYRQGGESNYKLDLGNKLWNIEKYEIKNVQAVDKPIEELCEISIDDYATIANDKIYFNPHLFLREESNPFVANSRNYPVDFERLTDNTVVCTLDIPEGYVVEELPENKVITLPGNAAKSTFSTTVNGNRIIVMSKVIFNKTLFMPEEYGGLKEFYGRLVAKKSENIVLKKK